MRKILDKLIWIGLFVFFVPTTLVIASWNSLPGDFMFPIKLGLERSLLVIVSPSYEVSGQLQIKYTERRFSDAQRLLAINNSVSGLPYLDQQVEAAKVSIEKAPNVESRQVLANQYIATLTQVSDDLEQQKLAITKTAVTSGNPGNAGQPAVQPSELIPVATATNKPTIIVVAPTATPTQAFEPSQNHQNVQTSTPTPTPGPTLATVVTTSTVTPPQNLVIAMQITETQHKISETIDDLKKQNKSDSHGNDGNKPDESKKSVTPDIQNNKDNK